MPLPPQTPRNTTNTSSSSSSAQWKADIDRRSSATPTGLPPAADPQDMLQLMRRTRGRIQGNVSFRKARSGSRGWLTSYCYIDTQSSALLFEVTTQTTDPSFEILVPDLRACQVCAVFDDHLHVSVLEVVYMAGNLQEFLRLRPDRQTYFNSWYAALLCWQSCQPGQKISDATPDEDSPAQPMLHPFVSDERPRTLVKNQRTNAPLRTERAMLLTEGSPDFSNLEYPSNTTATEVFCVLRGTGEFSVHALNSRRTLATFQLRSLPRTAIQRLNKTVFGLARTMAIYPQYTSSPTACSSVRPLYLSFNFTDSFEVVYILLKAFALPELHLLQPTPAADQLTSKRTSLMAPLNRKRNQFFRLDHHLNARIDKVRLLNELAAPPSSSDKERPFQQAQPEDALEFSEYYIELLVDEQIKAKTTVRASTKSGLFWAESFDVFDLPGVISSVSFRLKRRQIQESGSSESSETASIMTSKTGLFVRTVHSALDTTEGVAELNLNELMPSKDMALECNFIAPTGVTVGELTVKLRHEEHLMLTEENYDPLLTMLMGFENNVTREIFDRTPLRPGDLANCLLNIFQASGAAEIWLRHLVYDEIYKKNRDNCNGSDNPIDGTKSSKNSGTQASTRTNEALLLFRSNTLLTRALDSYMRRLGQGYLETTLRIKLQDIMDEDLDCEVDPSRLGRESDHEANWQRLMNITKEVWSFIRHSAFQCPKELRKIFRTIRDMATDRFGDVMPSKAYTSVSSFLFLRFFCAAIMGPKMFGLLKGEPGLKAQRTYMLVAKSLQGLANMSTFGNKEHWMAPMNTFCSTNRAQFEAFIDSVCDLEPDDLETSATEPVGATGASSEDENVDVCGGTQGEGRASLSSRINGQLERREPSLPSSYDPPSRPGSAATQIHVPSMRSATSGSPYSSESCALDPAADVALPGSRPSSPSMFNTEESVAYTSSFATEIPLTEKLGLTSPGLENFEFVSEPSNSNLEHAPVIAHGPRDTVNPVETVVYVGPQDDRKGHNTGPAESNHQDALDRLQGSGATDRNEQPTLYTKKDTVGENVDDPQEMSDNDSIYESAAGSPKPGHSRGNSLAGTLTQPVEEKKSVSEGTQPPLHKKDSHQDRVGPQDDPNVHSEVYESRSSTPQTVISRPPTAASIYSLKLRPSLDLPPNDPLRLILERLPPHAREGFLVLPGLIDPAKNLALLVNIWLDSLEVRIHRAAAAAAAKNADDGASIAPILKELDDPESNLALFHGICQQLKDKTTRYRQVAEENQEDMDTEEDDDVGITAKSIVVKWASTAERMEGSPHEFWVTRAEDRPSSRASSSLYPATIGSDEFGQPTSSQESIGPSSLPTSYPPAPAPSDIARDRNRGNKPKSGRLSLFGGGGSVPEQKSGPANKIKREPKPASVSSGGSDKTGQESRASTTKSSIQSRKKSPPRTAEDNAMRKLGWI